MDKKSVTAACVVEVGCTQLIPSTMRLAGCSLSRHNFPVTAFHTVSHRCSAQHRFWGFLMHVGKKIFFFFRILCMTTTKDEKKQEQMVTRQYIDRLQRLLTKWRMVSSTA